MEKFPALAPFIPKFDTAVEGMNSDNFNNIAFLT
jgi:hypothetical protein